MFRPTLSLASLLLMSGCTPEASTTGSIPAGLIDIEEAAEDAYDQALASDFEAVAADAETIDDAWQSFRMQAAADGASDDDLAAMDSAVTELVSASANPSDPVTLARAANAVSATMDELYALYHPKVPAAVLALDYLGREIVLDAKVGDFVAAGTDIDLLESTFDPIRDQLVDAGGAQEAMDYADGIVALRTDVANQDAQALESDANVELELVDAMENVFSGS